MPVPIEETPNVVIFLPVGSLFVSVGRVGVTQDKSRARRFASERAAAQYWRKNNSWCKATEVQFDTINTVME